VREAEQGNYLLKNFCLLKSNFINSECPKKCIDSTIKEENIIKQQEIIAYKVALEFQEISK
jgi:hypothetical protein